MNLIYLLFIISTPFHVILLLAATINLFIKRSEESDQTPGISVIVAARDEEHNLPRLLKSLDKLNYPKDLYEVIIINDHSTDGTLEILANHKADYNFHYIDWQGEQEGVTGKKAALLQGINAAKHDILAFTDADC
ncbi:MAG: glycosyltransferase, partial [Candidatus Cloacimonadaceae bacterium]